MSGRGIKKARSHYEVAAGLALWPYDLALL